MGGQHPLRSAGLRSSFGEELAGVTRPNLARVVGEGDGGEGGWGRDRGCGGDGKDAGDEGRGEVESGGAEQREKVMLVHEVCPFIVSGMRDPAAECDLRVL